MSKGKWKREEVKERVAVVVGPVEVVAMEDELRDQGVVVGPVNSDIITWVDGVAMCARCERSPEILEDGTVRRHQEMRAMPDVWMCPRCESWEPRR